jgi:hypothetical protein
MPRFNSIIVTITFTNLCFRSNKNTQHVLLFLLKWACLVLGLYIGFTIDELKDEKDINIFLVFQKSNHFLVSFFPKFIASCRHCQVLSWVSSNHCLDNLWSSKSILDGLVLMDHEWMKTFFMSLILYVLFGQQHIQPLLSVCLNGQSPNSFVFKIWSPYFHNFLFLFLM